MDVTLNLPEELIRKIRALNILTGGSSANFESTLIGIIEDSVSLQIVRSVSYDKEVLGREEVYSAAPAPFSRAAVSQAPRVKSAPSYSDDRDMTGVSAGLGDEDIDMDLGPEEDVVEVEEPVRVSAVKAAPVVAKKPRRARKPKTAPITDAELEHDLDVTDPEHEAAAEAPTFADQMGQEVEGEELFAQAAAFPVDARKARRKRNFGASKAKVTPMLEEAMDTF